MVNTARTKSKHVISVFTKVSIHFYKRLEIKSKKKVLQHRWSETVLNGTSFFEKIIPNFN